MSLEQMKQLLHAEKMQIHSQVESIPLKKTSRKFKIQLHEGERKNSKSIVSFFKLTKAKKHQKRIKKQERKQSFEQNGNKEEEKIKKQFQFFTQNESPRSQIGSEYGDYNYDNELHEVMKQKRNCPRKAYQTPNVIFRVDTLKSIRHKQAQYKRFEKFKTEMHEGQSNKQTCRRQITENIQQLEGLYFLNSSKEKLVNNTNIYNIKEQLKIYQINRSQTEPVDNGEEKISPRRQPSSVFGNFLQIANKKLQPVYVVEGLSHRRSNTEQSVEPKQKSQQIFENYKKLKETFRRISSTYREGLGRRKEKEKEKSVGLRDKNQEKDRVRKQQEKRTQHNSMPKCQMPLVLKDILCGQFLTYCGGGVSPKASVKNKIASQAMRRVIKDRQREFFQPFQTKKMEEPAFIVEQIRLRLARLEQVEGKGKTNRSLVVLQTKGNELLGRGDVVKGRVIDKQKDRDGKSNVGEVNSKGLGGMPNVTNKRMDETESQMRKRVLTKG